MIDSEIISVRAPAVSWDVRRQAIVLSIVALALVLRLYAISLYPLAGDEYSSLAEAKRVGLNWNSILYSGLMHFWIRFGSSEFWLRLPSAMFGTATVAILFKLGEKFGGWRTGVVAALLAATSPFSLYHSQEVRFYSLFIFSSAAFLLVTVTSVDSDRRVSSRVRVVLTAIVLIFSHFLGVLAVYAQSAGTYLAEKRSRLRLLLAIVVPTVVFALPLIPTIQRSLWALHRVYSNAASSDAPASTPLSLISLAKIGFAGYVFVFGYHVYPLRLAIVVIGGGVSVVFLTLGVIKFWKISRCRMLLVTYAVVILGIYLILDSVGGRLAAGVAPRHVSFAWPLFVLITALGVASLRKSLFPISLAAILLLNGFSVWARVNKSWVYGTMTDYRAASAFEESWASHKEAIVHDGRSADELSYYFRPNVPRISMWSLEQKGFGDLQSYDRLVMVTDDYQTERRRGFNQLLNRIDDSFSWISGRVDYPLFEYVLQRKTGPATNGFAVDPKSGQVRQPLSFYGLEFADLQLPVHITYAAKPLTIVGAYALPDTEGSKSVDIQLTDQTKANRLQLLTNVIPDRALSNSEAIATLEISNTDGQTFTYPLRLGAETASWDQQCSPQASCHDVYQWHKRAAMMGQNAYPGSFRDFPAMIHGVTISLSNQQTIRSLRIRYETNSGHLYLWGLSLSDE